VLTRCRNPSGKPKSIRLAGPGFEPVLRKTKVARNSTAGIDEVGRERISLPQRPGLRQRDHVNVLRRPIDQLQRKQRRAADNDKLIVVAASSELLR
jgi:hypothetical protein